METKTEQSFNKKTYLTGLSSVIISTVIFLLPDLFKNSSVEDELHALFFLNHLITCGYLVWMLVVEKKENRMQYTPVFWVLFMISAFALNRNMNVFYDSEKWLEYCLTGIGVATLILPIRKFLPRWVDLFIYLFIGLGIVVYTYYALYLLPMTIFGFLAIPALGLSAHTFVPIVFLFISIRDIVKNTAITYYLKSGLLIGIVAPLAFLTWYVNSWNTAVKNITFMYNNTVLSYNQKLPSWVFVSQQLEPDYINERVLKSGIALAEPKSIFGGLEFELFPEINRNFGNAKFHDPLIFTSIFLCGKTDIPVEDKIKILEAMYDSRHLAQERLWSGESLVTNNVISDIHIYPKLRIAYTEKILDIKNNTSPKKWNSTREAIYTFHLPEGAVVTSLSLWINGKEEKGYLTTKSKAQKAYREIVGVERRDPSVVHWQEGNTISVRVFPCTTNEMRKFKIGITTPLRKTGNQLEYTYIKFEGPDSEEATESCKLVFTDEVSGWEKPQGFELSGKRTYMYNGKYNKDFSVKFNTPEMSDNQFYFAGSSYKISEYTKKYEYFDAEAYYLDINKQWTKEEFEHLWKMAGGKKVYAVTDEVVQLTEENKGEYFDLLSKRNYTLFPIQDIRNTNCIVISKAAERSPNLKDLGECEYALKLSESLTKGNKIRIFNIGEKISPYIKTLRDFRAVTYDNGTMSALDKLITEKQFVIAAETDNDVILHDAGIRITENKDTVESPNTAPDHLLRLFSYNNILKKIGPDYFKKDYIRPELIEEAEKAYVVSPVSSLIVLETQADYDRFDIKDSKNQSLKNASANGSGAVPEPHEWALIILVCCIMVYLKFKNRFQWS